MSLSTVLMSSLSQLVGLPLGSPAEAPPSAAVASEPGPCGWLDSSLDLARGLEVCEQDDDSLLQLWRLAQ